MMQVDLILFAGQSNMAGRGITGEQWPQGAPEVKEGMGFEFRAVTAPDRLFPLQEPFGREENRSGAIDDAQKKTGSMVSAFVNTFTAHTKVPVVGVSASEGGTSIAQWQPGQPRFEDLAARWQRAEQWLEANGYNIRHRLAAWCQGETDGDLGTTEENYKDAFRKLWQALQGLGIERLFLISIGQRNRAGLETAYDPVIRWQQELGQTTDGVIPVAENFISMRARGLMKDSYHYFQQGYNETGAEAGRRAAEAIAAMDKQQPAADVPEKLRNYAYFSHKECEYFPCHPGADPGNFNCLFCYCPFYLLGTECGGSFRITEKGIKDCSNCLYPHHRENYDEIIRRYREIAAAMPRLKKQSDE